MTIGELRDLLEGLDSDKNLMIAVPRGHSYLLYSKCSLEKEKMFNGYKLVINANY